MTGVAVKGKDRAGGKQDQQANGWFRINGDPVVTVGDTVEGHGSHGPAVMVEGEDFFRVGGRPVCRAEHKSSCGHGTTGRQRFRLVRASSGYRNYLTSPADPCNVEHIPWIMRANGWHEGAKLMDRWFSLPASTDKTAVPPDNSTVSMDFILSFADAQSHYQNLLNPQNWTVPNDSQGLSAIQRLCKQLATRQLLTASRESFDDFHLPVQELRARKWQIDTRRPRPQDLPPLDGLTAALGKFEFFLVVAGEVEPAAVPPGTGSRSARLACSCRMTMTSNNYSNRSETGT
jgi:uncharacterized Zn-binding protein involved in type VI secretion